MLNSTQMVIGRLRFGFGLHLTSLMFYYVKSPVGKYVGYWNCEDSLKMWNLLQDY